MVKASAFPSKSEQSEMSVLILLIQHSIRSSIQFDKAKKDTSMQTRKEEMKCHSSLSRQLQKIYFRKSYLK